MATSGLTTVDYFIGDPQLPCPGTDHLFSEKIFRLKQHVSGCFRPLDELPVGPSPYFKNGYITFGCFNDIRKIMLPMVQLWALVLHLHPTSKLLLKFGGVDQHNIQCRFVEWFRTAGVAPERLMFEGWSNKTEYMLSWNRVDIALDPFPYNGGTTSMDTLWMGVPLLSMAGRLTVSCAGASMLSAIGLPVARNAEQYLALSGSLVEAVQKAPDIRQRIRQSLINSPLMDGRGLMLELEAAYRQMWRDWCAQQKQSAGVSQPDLMEEIAGTFSTTSGAARNSEAEPSAAPGQHGSYSQAIQATSPTA
jgi:predicted O-linked N-acetylglucosamine transferase (SPINDLY family)